MVRFICVVVLLFDVLFCLCFSSSSSVLFLLYHMCLNRLWENSNSREGTGGHKDVEMDPNGQLIGDNEADCLEHETHTIGEWLRQQGQFLFRLMCLTSSKVRLG